MLIFIQQETYVTFCL